MPTMRSSTASGVAVPAAFLTANALSYALLLAAAHRMSAADYGELSSLLGLLLISTVPMLALQTVAARRAAAERSTAGVVAGTAQVAALTVGLLCLASPALSAFLHLHDVVSIVLVALTVPATSVIGAATGIAQGRRSFGRLAVLILLGTGSRSLGGLIGLILGRTPDATIAGVLVGVSMTALVIAIPGRELRPTRQAAVRRDRTGMLAETLHAGHAHGTFLLLTSLDVLLARHVLSASQAGVYAVGSVVTRAALWFPQSVVLLLFASLAERHRHKAAARRATAVVATLGLLVVAGTAVLGRLVVDTVGGRRYQVLDGTVWLYALLGSLLAVVQLAVLAGLAQRNRRRAALLWVTIAVDVVAALSVSGHATPTMLVTIYVTVAAGAATTALWLTLRQANVANGRWFDATRESSISGWDSTPRGAG